MGWQAGEDMPRLLPAAFRRPQRQKRRPRNGERITPTPPDHFARGLPHRGASEILTPSRGPPYQEPIGQSSIAPQRPRVLAGPPAIRQAISRLAIVKAIQPGSKRARNQRSYLRAVLADPEIAALRADRRRAVLELARILARHANWRTMTSWRPRERACAEIGSSRDPSKPLSISAYKAARRVLEERGFLGLVAQGWTSRCGQPSSTIRPAPQPCSCSPSPAANSGSAAMGNLRG